MLKSLTRILPFLIVTLLCIGGVELLYGLAEHYMEIPERAAVQGEASVAAVEEKPEKVEKHRNYAVIVERNLFQSYEKEPEKVEPVKENPLEGLEATTLDLVLMGTVSGQSDRSRAIILEKAKRKQEIYYVGDVIQGAEIKEIMRGKVILSYQGKDEILDMSEASKMKPPVSSSPTAVSPVVPRARVVAPPQQQPLRRVVPRDAEVEEQVEEVAGDDFAEELQPIEGDDFIQDSGDVPEQLEENAPAADESSEEVPAEENNGRDQDESVPN